MLKLGSWDGVCDTLDEDVLLLVGVVLVGPKEVTIEGQCSALPDSLVATDICTIFNVEVLDLLSDLVEVGRVNLDDSKLER